MQLEDVLAVFKRCNIIVLGYNFCYRRIASAEPDLIPVIKYPGTTDLLDPRCKERFAQYKKGVPTPMSSEDLEWSRLFVSLCIDERPLPPFVHQAASTNPFTGEKIAAKDVKPDLTHLEPAAVVTAATVVNGVIEFADTATQSASQRYPLGLGNIMGLTPEPQPDASVPVTSGAASSRDTMPVKIEPRTFTQLKKYDGSVIVDLDDEDTD
eukprot:3387901-Amphidinium_carterae.1